MEFYPYYTSRYSRLTVLGLGCVGKGRFKTGNMSLGLAGWICIGLHIGVFRFAIIRLDLQLL